MNSNNTLPWFIFFLVAFLARPPVFAEEEKALLDIYNIPSLPYSLETDEDVISISSPVISRQTIYIDTERNEDAKIRIAYKTLLGRNLKWSGIFDVATHVNNADYTVSALKNSETGVTLTLRIANTGELVLADNIRYYADDARKTEFAVIDAINKIVEVLTDVEGPLGKAILYSEKKVGTAFRSIMLTDTHGLYKKTLIDNGNLNFYPRWSPGGDKFSFITLGRMGYTLKIYSFRTGKILHSKIFASSMSGGSWYADGEKIAVTISKNGNSDIFVLNTDDLTVSKQLTNYSSIETSGSVNLTNNAVVLSSDKSGSPQIYEVGNGEGRLKRLTFKSKYNTEPRWNPQKHYLVYSSIIGGSMEIMLYNYQTADIMRVTRAGKSSEQGGWSPDGRQIIFSKQYGDNAKIHIMNMDGSYARKLTYTGKDVTESDPDWSNFSIRSYIKP